MPYDFKLLKKQLSKFLGYYSRSELFLVPQEELLNVYQSVTAVDWIIAQGLGGCSVSRDGKPAILISKKHAVSKAAAFFIAGHEMVEEYLRTITDSEDPGSEKVTYSTHSYHDPLSRQKFTPETLRKARQRIVRFLLEDDYTLDVLLEELLKNGEKESFFVQCRDFNSRSLKEGFCSVLGGVIANYDSRSPEKELLKEELIKAVERAENSMKNWQTLEKSLERYRQELNSWDFTLLRETALFTTLVYDSGILKCVSDLRSKTIAAWEEVRISEWSRNVIQKAIKPGEGIFLLDSADSKASLFLKSLKELEKTREMYKEARSKAYFLGIEIDKALVDKALELSPIRADLENLLE